MFLALSLVLVGAPGQAGSRPLKPVKNVIAGRVTDAGGHPLADATVGVYGTTNAGENTRFEVTTDANGLYRQRVPAGIYGASAYYERYNRDLYKFTLRPDDGVTAKRHDSEPGVVKNFTWRISGLKPGERAGEAGTSNEPRKYYGNSAQLSVKQDGFDTYRFPAGSWIEVVFTPDGRLVNGMAGTPQTRTFAYNGESSSSSRNLYASDLTVGAYIAAATYVAPDGARRTLALKASTDWNGAFAPSLKVPFRPTQFGDLQAFQITIEPPPKG